MENNNKFGKAKNGPSQEEGNTTASAIKHFQFLSIVKIFVMESQQCAVSAQLFRKKNRCNWRVVKKMLNLRALTFPLHRYDVQRAMKKIICSPFHVPS